ncbi:hypothetical protein BGW38_005763 [Lunasporangiospora selenospora]|uniref:G domain-containing protein n=1 Tax=Lunasporangiospora selenospora TaxID=979761 RepID=A0A9P6FZG3_9FUNG|nr:hypothetical protein BGW38_005763 [Lunasporangiospora selenospora]
MMQFDEQPNITVIFIGNKGSGKSALLSQIGGSFDRGISSVIGYTTETSGQTILLNGQQVVLIDTPGLYDVDEETTQSNTTHLTEARRKGYHYKIFFIDLVLVRKVNEALSQANDAQVEFRMIVNQIRSDKERENYYHEIVKDKCTKLFQDLREQYQSLLFNIHINDIMLLRYDEDAVRFREFKDRIINQILAQDGIPLKVKPIQAPWSDVANMKKYLTGAVVAVPVILAVVGLANFPSPRVAAEVATITVSVLSKLL